MNNNSGELVKKYRTLLKISQKEAAGNRMSHSMVSLIESGKIQMTTVTAMILADNFNKIAASKGLELNLSLKDLFGCYNCGIDAELQKSLSDISTEEYDEKKYEKLFIKAKENNCFDIMAQIKQNEGDIKQRSENYLDAIEKYKDAKDLFQLTQNHKGIAEIIVELAKCHNSLKQYEKAEEYAEKAKNDALHKYHDEQILFSANYQQLIAMVNTKRHEDALKTIENMLKNKRLTITQRKDVLIIKAGIFIDEARLCEAINILKKLVLGSSSSDYLIYHKLALASILLGQRQEGIFYLSQCINLLSVKPHSKNTKTALLLADEFKIYNIYSSSIKYYDFALNNSEMFNQPEYKLHCYKSLFHIYEYDKFTNFDKYLVDLKQLLINEDVEYLTSYLILISKFYVDNSRFEELKLLIYELNEKYK